MWAVAIPIIQAILGRSHNQGAQKAANLLGMFNSAKSLTQKPKIPKESINS